HSSTWTGDYFLMIAWLLAHKAVTIPGCSDRRVSLRRMEDVDTRSDRWISLPPTSGAIPHAYAPRPRHPAPRATAGRRDRPEGPDGGEGGRLRERRRTRPRGTGSGPDQPAGSWLPRGVRGRAVVLSGGHSAGGDHDERRPRLYPVEEEGRRLGLRR